MVKRKDKQQEQAKIPEYGLRTLGRAGDTETSGSSGIGLRSGFLEAMSLSPYKDFSTPFFLFAFFFLPLLKT